MAQFATTFFGQPSSAPTLTDLMDAWIKQVENSSVLSEDNQGDNSPQALAAECLAEGQQYIAALQVFNPPPPDAKMSTVLPYRDRILFEASFMPPQQWNPATYRADLPNTIALAMASAQTAASQPAPAPPVSPVRVGACFQGPNGMVCAAGPGSSMQNTTDGQIVTNPDGSQYVAHITQFLMGSQLWFSPLPKP